MSGKRAARRARGAHRNPRRHGRWGMRYANRGAVRHTNGGWWHRLRRWFATRYPRKH